MTISATIDFLNATHTRWDAVVVGAGPAGSIAAQQLSLQGFRTLLVDRKSFPRNKTCGACVNGRAVAILQQLGLDGILKQSNSVPLKHFQVRSRGRQVIIPLPGGVALTRAALDAGLVQAAIEARAEFLPETSATLCDVSQAGCSRHVNLVQNGNVTQTVSADVVLLADGLGNSSLRQQPELCSSVAPTSRIGLGASLKNSPDVYEAGTIFMAIGKWGYVGLVRVEDGSLNIAAALDPGFVKGCSQQAEPIATILEEACFPAIDGLESAKWSGTVPLTRTSLRPAGKRVLILGDAAGYVEPFTGEGVSNALCSGVAAASLVSSRLKTWDQNIEQEWVRRHRQIVRDRQHWCRWLARLSRHPRAVHAVLYTISLFPWLVRPVVKYLNAPAANLSGLIDAYD